MHTMHLFAGIGGGLLADLILGHRPIVAVEWDKYACQVLRERAADGWFPDLSVWEGDVRLFDPSEYTGKVDCIHAGFPCQDLSVAGNQAGLGEETRSGLYREVIRIAGIVRPCYIFLENVAAILGNGLECVLADLAAMGFDAEWGCVRASDCGAPHIRDRWWLLAHSNSDEWRTSGMGQDTGTNGRNDSGWMGKVFSDSECFRLPGQRESVDAVHSAPTSHREATESINGSEPGFWSIEPGLGRVAHGISNRLHKLKGLGNAQVPIQAAVAWKLLGGP